MGVSNLGNDPSFVPTELFLPWRTIFPFFTHKEVCDIDNRLHIQDLLQTSDPVTKTTWGGGWYFIWSPKPESARGVFNSGILYFEGRFTQVFFLACLRESHLGFLRLKPFWGGLFIRKRCLYQRCNQVKRQRPQLFVNLGDCGWIHPHISSKGCKSFSMAFLIWTKERDFGVQFFKNSLFSFFLPHRYAAFTSKPADRSEGLHYRTKRKSPSDPSPQPRVLPWLHWWLRSEISVPR